MFMKSRMLTISGIIAVAALTATLIWGRTTSSRRTQANEPVQQATFLVAAAGRVEPGSEDIKLSSELNGKLKSIQVEEGDRVARGQVLAELQNDDYRAQVASADAEVRQREAELRKVINGARSQE